MRNDPDLRQGVENFKCYPPDRVEAVLALDRVNDPVTGVTSFYARIVDGTEGVRNDDISAGAQNGGTSDSRLRRVH